MAAALVAARIPEVQARFMSENSPLGYSSRRKQVVPAPTLSLRHATTELTHFGLHLVLGTEAVNRCGLASLLLQVRSFAVVTRSVYRVTQVRVPQDVLSSV